jgi:osmoprotectant transport system permease protein
VSEQLQLLPALLTAHLQLTLAALLGGALLSIPLGVLVRRAPRLEPPLLAFVGAIQTVPALALLAGMVPLLVAFGLPGIGVLPAFLGLTLYSLLPMLRNTVTGLAGIDPAVVEAARGVGMTRGQRLRRVELPLALPTIVAGVRTSAVWTVGMATLSTPVGAPSLGNFIFSGLQTRNLAAILVGCISAAALAMTLDGLVQAVSRGYSERRPWLLRAGLVGLGALCAWALAPLIAWTPLAPARTVRIGAKTFTEQYILAEVLARQVRLETGGAADVRASLGSTVAFDALTRDEIDAYVEYTGTIWATLMGHTSTPGDRARVLAEVTEWLEATHGVRVAARLGFENAYAFAMPRAAAERLGIRRLSDLVPYAARLRAGGDYEFWSRSEWRDVRAAYGIDFAERRSMDPALMYTAVKLGQVDVISAFSSDGRLAAFNLVTLEDDLGAIPPYDAIVIVGRALQRDRPDVVAAFRKLDGRIPVERMRAMNRAVDSQGRSPSAVASELLGRTP